MKIWDVLNVATVDGGIIVKERVVQKNPNNPIIPTPRQIPITDNGILEISGVKNLSSSSKTWQKPDITSPPQPI